MFWGVCTRSCVWRHGIKPVSHSTVCPPIVAPVFCWGPWNRPDCYWSIWCLQKNTCEREREGRGGGGGSGGRWGEGKEDRGREERVAEGELELLEHPLRFTAQQYNWDNGQNKAVQQRPLQACHLPSSVAHFSLQHNTVHRVSTQG